jgi:hypothetical protein
MLCWGRGFYGQLGYDPSLTEDQLSPRDTYPMSLGSAALSERDFNNDGILNIFEDRICPIGSYQSSIDSNICILASPGHFVSEIG